MKKISIITKMSFILFMSVVLSIVIWSCTEDNDPLTIDGPELTSLSPDSGFVGTEVIINGNNFSTVAALNAVSFNGTAATVIAVDAISITTTVPEGATSGGVTVTTNGKTSNAVEYTVLIPIIPTITSISPDNGDIGDEVIITGTDFSTTPEDNIVSFNGGIATVTASTETTITTTVPTTGSTGNVTVTRDGESNGVLFTVTTPIYTLTRMISTDEDDVEEGSINGAMALTSSDLEMAEWDDWTQGDIEQGVQIIGIRFDTISIPAGATILNATIQFEVDEVGDNSPAQLTVYGENVGNAAIYEDIAYNVTSRARTTANAVWDIAPWLEVGDRLDAQKTVDLSSIVQEIVDRGDWASGNALNFILEASGPSVGQTSTEAGRVAEGDVDSNLDAPTLTIIYQ